MGYTQSESHVGYHWMDVCCGGSLGPRSALSARTNSKATVAEHQNTIFTLSLDRMMGD